MGKLHRAIQRMDVQVSLFTALMVLLSCLFLYAVSYHLTYKNMIHVLEERVYSIANAADSLLDKEGFFKLYDEEDMNSDLYLRSQEELYRIKLGTGVRYLYTATRTEDGEFIYLVDGLDLSAEDFRHPGDPIEPEIIPELEYAMTDHPVLPDSIKNTEWGKIFIAYIPIHDDTDDQVVGVLGVEFEAESQFNTYRNLKFITPMIILLTCLLAGLLALRVFRRISNPTFQDASNTDYLTGLKSRNAFQTDLSNANARRTALPGCSMILLDLNELKLVNDSLGHNSGDLYLQLAAQAIRAALDKQDIAYRIGGDEFAIITPLQEDADIKQLVERVRHGLEQLRPENWTAPLSFSAGWATFDPTRDGDLSAAYHRADDAMYLDKQQYHGT